MTPNRQSHLRRQRRLPVTWHDCAWFPPVLAGKAGGSRRGRQVYWPVQIITDPTVCASRALDPIIMKTSQRKSPGFTLIELLVVIAIIAILAAMLFPAIGVAKRKAAETRAKAEMQQIGMAITRYETDYNGRFPAPGVQTGGNDVTYGYTLGGMVPPITPIGTTIAITTNSGVIAALMDVEKFNNGVDSANKGHVMNPRRVPVLNANFTSDASSGGVGPDGEYRDPWGSPYVISMDTSMNDRCRDQLYSRRNVSQEQAGGQKGLLGLFNPNAATPNTDDFEFNGKFMIWSLGADKKASAAINPQGSPYGGAKKGDNKDNLITWQE